MPRTVTDSSSVPPGVHPGQITIAPDERVWESGSPPVRDKDVDVFQVTGGQQLLFGPNPQVLCDEIGLSWARALDLYRDGFLSFSPSMVQRLDETQETELRFLGALSRAGCDRQMLSRLLRGLSYPYSYDISQIYFSLEEGQWRMLPEKNSDPETALTEWLDVLVRNNDVETLAGIVELAREALHRLGHTK